MAFPPFIIKVLPAGTYNKSVATELRDINPWLSTLISFGLVEDLTPPRALKVATVNGGGAALYPLSIKAPSLFNAKECPGV